MNDYIDLKVPAAKRPRLLRGNEIVRTGDFVEGKDGAGSYVPWEGPAGFQANAFHKPIYRESSRGTPRSTPAHKPTATRQCVAAPTAPTYLPCLSVSGQS